MQLSTINQSLVHDVSSYYSSYEQTQNKNNTQFSKLTNIYLNLIDDIRTIVDEYLLDRKLINQLRIELQTKPKLFGIYRCIIVAQNLDYHGTEKQKIDALNLYYENSLKKFNLFISKKYQRTFQFENFLEEYLEKKGIIPNEDSLLMAVTNNDVRYLNILLKYGGRLSEESKDKYNPVICKAMIINQKDIIETLINFNVAPIRFLHNINSVTEINIISFILNKGAIPDAYCYEKAIIFNKKAIPLYLKTVGIPGIESITLSMFYPWDSEAETLMFIKSFINKGAVPDAKCLAAAEQFNLRTLLEQYLKLKTLNHSQSS